MAAAITFYTNNQLIPHTTGSGLGFFGAGGFGTSISVGDWNGRTFVCASNGSSQGAEGNSVAWANTGSGIIGQAGSGVGLKNIPNYQSTLQIRFTYDSAVQVQAGKLYGYDRTSINNPPSGITFRAAEAIHPSTSQLVVGSGDDTWTTLQGTGSYLTLANSPGASGHYAGNGSNSTRADSTHDLYVNLTASPDSIGSKTFAALVSLEYL